MDQKPESHTYGCADPEYWRDRRRGFCRGPMQGIALPLAQMASSEGLADAERRRELIRLSIAAIRFGLGLAAGDGSIAARAASERSPLATALAAAPLLEAACLIEGEIQGETRSRLAGSARRCARFLAQFDEPWPATFGRLLAAWAVDRAAEFSGDQTLRLKARDLVSRALDPVAADGLGMPEGLGQDAAFASASLGVLARFGRIAPRSAWGERAAGIVKSIEASFLPAGPIAGSTGSMFGGLALPHGLAALGIRVGQDGAFDSAAQWHPLAAAWIASDLWHAAQCRAPDVAGPLDRGPAKPYGCLRLDASLGAALASPVRGLAFALSSPLDKSGGPRLIALDEGVVVELEDGRVYASGLADPTVRARRIEGGIESHGSMKILVNPRLDRRLPFWAGWQSDLAYQVHRRRIRRIIEPPAGPIRFRRELRARGDDLLCIDELLYNLDIPAREIRLGGPLQCVERLLAVAPGATIPGSVCASREHAALLMRAGRLRIERCFNSDGLKEARFS